MPVRKLRPLLLMPAFMAGMAQAQDLCASLEALVEQAGTNFATPAQHPALPGAPECDLSLSQNGAREYHCAWAFEYRAPDARVAFEAYDRDIRRCLHDAEQAADDATVNHPDSYMLRQYRSAKATVSLALKDKAALTQTYVFLRVHAPDP